MWRIIREIILGIKEFVEEILFSKEVIAFILLVMMISAVIPIIKDFYFGG